MIIIKCRQYFSNIPYLKYRHYLKSAIILAAPQKYADNVPNVLISQPLPPVLVPPTSMTPMETPKNGSVVETPAHSNDNYLRASKSSQITAPTVIEKCLSRKDLFIKDDQSGEFEINNTNNCCNNMILVKPMSPILTGGGNSERKFEIQKEELADKSSDSIKIEPKKDDSCPSLYLVF